MTEQLYFEDFQVGQRFKSASRTLTDSHFALFSATTGDNHLKVAIFRLASSVVATHRSRARLRCA